MTTHYKPAARYELVRLADGAVVGEINQGVFDWASHDPTGTTPYSGRLCRLDGVLTLLAHSGAVMGAVAADLTLEANGGPYLLRQVPRAAGRQSVDDPDVYRAWRDCATSLAEAGNDKGRLLLMRVQAAAFDPCPVCNDHYGLAEGCAGCDGLGFVPEV